MSPFRTELLPFSAVNSINWARIAAQIPYYAAAALALGGPDREVAFSVPTGNFGNILAAWAARRIGLGRWHAWSSDRTATISWRRFLGNSDDMSMAPVEPSLSPSMDIQVSSNFERLLFELLDSGPIAATDPCENARLSRDRPHGNARTRCGTRYEDRVPRLSLDDPEYPTAEIRSPWHVGCGYLADPHTAIGVAAAQAHPPAHGVPTVAMATAHPAKKFPDAVERAIRHPPRGCHPGWRT